MSGESRTLVVAGVGNLGPVGTIALGAPPEVSDPGAQVISFFKEHQHGARVDAWITTFSALGIAVIVGPIATLRSRPRARLGRNLDS